MTSALATSAVPSTRVPATASRVVLRAAPDREPPFDDELVDRSTGATRYDVGLPLTLVRPAPPRPPLVIERPSGLPDPKPWVRRLMVGMTETAAGRRPLQQLAAFLTPAVHRGLAAELDRAGAGRAAHWLAGSSVRAVRSSEPSAGVAEMCAVIDAGARAHAVALRLEEQRGHWVCTRLQLG